MSITFNKNNNLDKLLSSAVLVIPREMQQLWDVLWDDKTCMNNIYLLFMYL